MASSRAAGCAWIRPWWRPTSTIRPTARCWGTGAGADPHHEEDHGHRRRGWNRAARPQPECEAAAVRDRANSACQGPAQSGPVAAALSPIARYDEPGGGTGEAVLERDRRRSEAVRGHSETDRTGGPARGTRQDVAAGAAGHASNAGAHLPWRYPRRRQ